MADTVDMIIPLLREMRAENAALHEETRELIKALDKRLGSGRACPGQLSSGSNRRHARQQVGDGRFEERDA
jgi:hypothetical protein